MSMRLIYFFAMTIVLATQVFSQQGKDTTINQIEIVGVWQVNSSTVSSALQANFQFFKTGKFIYNLSGYSDLNPIYNISGSYKIEQNILYLKIEQFKELTGFKIIESSPGFQFGSFVLDSGKVVTIKQKDTTYSEHEIKIATDPTVPAQKYIEIDSDKYFRLSRDPMKFAK